MSASTWRATPLAAVARLVAIVAVATIAAAGCGGGSAGSQEALHGVVRTPPLEVGEVTLPEVTGPDTTTPFRFAAERGTLLLAFFGYTNCPDLCPTTLADIKVALADLGAEASKVQVAMVTIDPARDTPDRLLTYLHGFFPAGTVHAIRTIDPVALRAAETPFLVRHSIMAGADGSYRVSHTAQTFVIDPSGTVLLEWPFNTHASSMAADLQRLLAAPTGSTVDSRP